MKFTEKVAVLHFDSHIDTWDPVALGGNISSYSQLNHGTFLHYAHELGYLDEDSNMHVGIRAPWFRKDLDSDNDKRCGFDIVTARQIDVIGVNGVVKKNQRQNWLQTSISFNLMLMF
jgi:agmatinase